MVLDHTVHTLAGVLYRYQKEAKNIEKLGVNEVGVLMMLIAGINLAFQPNLFRFLSDQGLLDATMNQEMIVKLLSIGHFWMIGIYFGLSVVMVFRVISYYLGYRILKNWKNDQWNIQNLIRKTAYCIFATQIIALF